MSDKWNCQHKIRYAARPKANWSVGPYFCDICKGYHMSSRYADPNALLAQRIEHEPSKLGVDGSNPSERAMRVNQQE